MFELIVRTGDLEDRFPVTLNKAYAILADVESESEWFILQNGDCYDSGKGPIE